MLVAEIGDVDHTIRSQRSTDEHTQRGFLPDDLGLEDPKWEVSLLTLRPERRWTEYQGYEYANAQGMAERGPSHDYTSTLRTHSDSGLRTANAAHRTIR
ncbi:MAG: hypothetical protein PVF27_04085 [Gemmatimonadales bacterium]